MPKVDMELVKLTLQRREELDARAVAQILEELDFESRAGKEESAAPREKMRFLAITRAGSTDREGNSEGWIVQVPERADFDVPAAIRAAARDFNDSPKGRRLPALRFPREPDAGTKASRKTAFPSPRRASRNK